MARRAQPCSSAEPCADSSGRDGCGQSFDAWLREAVAADAGTRDVAPIRWEEAPNARIAHPREEHLLPLMVVAGAAGDDRGRVPCRGTFAQSAISAAHFGDGGSPAHRFERPGR